MGAFTVRTPRSCVLWRNYVRNQQILPTHVPTKMNIADLFTKAIVEYQRFDMLRRACGMVESE
jgi:hypothetical protein